MFSILSRNDYSKMQIQFYSIVLGNSVFPNLNKKQVFINKNTMFSVFSDLSQFSINMIMVVKVINGSEKFLKYGLA